MNIVSKRREPNHNRLQRAAAQKYVGQRNGRRQSHAAPARGLIEGWHYIPGFARDRWANCECDCPECRTEDEDLGDIDKCFACEHYDTSKSHLGLKFWNQHQGVAAQLDRECRKVQGYSWPEAPK